MEAPSSRHQTGVSQENHEYSLSFSQLPEDAGTARFAVIQETRLNPN